MRWPPRRSSSPPAPLTSPGTRSMSTEVCTLASEATRVALIGADAVADAFVRHGIERIHVFPGGTIAPVFVASLARGIEIFTARHEQGAGYAALAAARLRGRPEVAMVTSGPGVTNL